MVPPVRRYAPEGVDILPALRAATTTLALLALAACGGSTGSGSPTGVTVNNEGCSDAFSGMYLFTYTDVSGNCGAIAPVESTTMGNPATNLANACPGGSGTITEAPVDAGGCEISGELTGCQVSGSSQTFDFTEDATWNAGYTMATGTVSISIPGNCSGSYTLTAAQQ